MCCVINLTVQYLWFWVINSNHFTKPDLYLPLTCCTTTNCNNNRSYDRSFGNGYHVGLSSFNYAVSHLSFTLILNSSKSSRVKRHFHLQSTLSSPKELRIAVMLILSLKIGVQSLLSVHWIAQSLFEDQVGDTTPHLSIIASIISSFMFLISFFTSLSSLSISFIFWSNFIMPTFTPFRTVLNSLYASSFRAHIFRSFKWLMTAKVMLPLTCSSIARVTLLADISSAKLTALRQLSGAVFCNKSDKAIVVTHLRHPVHFDAHWLHTR